MFEIDASYVEYSLYSRYFFFFFFSFFSFFFFFFLLLGGFFLGGGVFWEGVEEKEGERRIKECSGR